jgi:hypothetical protein
MNEAIRFIHPKNTWVEVYTCDFDISVSHGPSWKGCSLPVQNDNVMGDGAKG